jgi:predicted HicB family RNase H-like nuclease
MNVAHYSLILINPTIDRLDTVVAGVAIHRSEGWDVRMAASVQKMKAIDPSFPDSRLLQTSALAYELAQNANDLRGLKASFEGARLGVLVDAFVGSFTYSTEDEYQHEVKSVLAESVNPPNLALANAAPITRRRNVVRRKLRDHFRARNLWSRNDQDINLHRVVEHFPISAAHGVIADFALKNSVMHITETIDFEVQSLKGRKLEAQAKTFVLNEACRVFGLDTKRYVVAAGTSNPDVKPSVLLLSEHANVYALESSSDMNNYVEQIAAAAFGSQTSILLP